MDKQTKVKVTNKWEGDFVVIYSIQNMEDENLAPLLLFYNIKKAPKFKNKQEFTIEEIEKTGFYKVVKFNSWDDIPNDVAMAITFN